mgnify:CR=1 FL=1
MDYDIVIIGAGVVGLSSAKELSTLKKNVLVIEKNESFGMETSSRSSEVIHAGVYYPKNSLKANLCIKGNELLYQLATKYNIPYKNCGKLIVATTSEEESRLQQIMNHSISIGAKKVRILDKNEIKNLEPNVNAKSAIFFPTSGIIDSHSLMKFFFTKAKDGGVDFLFRSEVIAIEKMPNCYKILIKENNQKDFSLVTTKVVINAAGLNSGKIAEIAGFDIDKLKYKIYYRKGIYFRVQKNLQKMPRMLIYPVPLEDATVGIHTVPELTGGMRLGPYDLWSKEIDYSVDESLLDLFYNAVKNFIPLIEKDNLNPDMAGIQAKRYGKGEKSRDFVIKEESEKGFPNFINLIGIESPGLTCSPAIGIEVKEIVKKL